MNKDESEILNELNRLAKKYCIPRGDLLGFYALAYGRLEKEYEKENGFDLYHLLKTKGSVAFDLASNLIGQEALRKTKELYGE